jgi:type IV secretory pathway VirB4 component
MARVLPGHVYANVRQPLVHTLNLAHLMPLSAIWAGRSRNAISGPALAAIAQTAGATPFRLSTHVGDVGHMLIVGPTGAGKSVLLALIALQFRRYPGAQVYVFDKGFSARAAVLAMGGAHHALGLGADAGGTLAFQPLRNIDNAPEERAGPRNGSARCSRTRNRRHPGGQGGRLVGAKQSGDRAVEQRTLTGLALLLQSAPCASALAPYTLEGPYGRLLDAADQDPALADIQCFETEALMGQAGVVAPVLTYLFHRLEERFDGRPTLLILDEAWIFLDHPLFAARIREWLKVLRKKNVSVMFATQSLADIADSALRPRSSKAVPSASCCPTTVRSSRRAAAPMRGSGSTRGRSSWSPRDAQTPLLSPVSARQPAVRARSRVRSRLRYAARPIPPASAASTRSSPSMAPRVSLPAS